ncbi:hypothetical protein AYO38_02510 [bacterium SCGC AG-212-C10]|nr:hypothetical protein AYO38_02510 [bacterium SCGC AG-212-C10]
MLRIVVLCSVVSAFLAAAVASGTTAVLAGARADVAPAATPLASTFTYQGRLEDDDDPATGSYDFQFLLFDAATGGAQVGTTIAAPAVPVQDGLFAVTLNFGQVFDGNGRWLEVRVRASGSGVHESLGRQELTATPYALYAKATDWAGIQNIPGAFSDGADNDTLYSASPPIIQDGTTFYLSNAGCSTGDVWKYTGAGTTWSCDPDENGGGDITSVVAGAGLTGGAIEGPATLSVIFGINGSQSVAARADHNHVGQLWQATSNNRLLELSNQGTGDGLRVTTQDGAGLTVSSNSNAITASSTNGYGVRGSSGGCLFQGSPSSSGVYGCGAKVGSVGVTGNASASTGGANGIGIYGSAGSFAPIVPMETGVYGYATGAGTGVYGLTNGVNSSAVKGRVINAPGGALAGYFLGAPVKMDDGCLGCSPPSDARLKHDVAPSQYGLAAIAALNPVSFVYNEETYGTATHLGFIAQHVKQIIPELASAGDDGYLTLDYDGLIPVLVKAIQEQQAQIAQLQASAQCRE